jgi:hypothetical protein
MEMIKIKDMEMPRCCIECRFRSITRFGLYYCMAVKDGITPIEDKNLNKRQDFCPLSK